MEPSGKEAELAKKFSSFTSEVAEWLSHYDAVDVFRCFVGDADMDVVSSLTLSMSVQTKDLHDMNSWNDGNSEEKEKEHSASEEDCATTVLAMIRLKQKWLWIRSVARTLYGEAVTDIEIAERLTLLIRASVAA